MKPNLRVMLVTLGVGLLGMTAAGCGGDDPPPATVPAGTSPISTSPISTSPISTSPAGSAAVVVPADSTPGGSGPGGPATGDTAAAVAVEDATVYRAVATAIQEPGKPPMIAFALRESFPPQGGDLVLDNFSWDEVDSEQTASGTTWLDGVVFVGRRTATGFRLSEPPVLGAPPLTDLTYDKLSEGCTEQITDPLVAKLDKLDAATLGVLGYGPHTFDGHCGVVITAMFDTPALRDAVMRLLGNGADVSYDFQFRPVS